MSEWIPHKPDDVCPVDPETDVEVRIGSHFTAIAKACEFGWEQTKLITAWRLHA